MFYLCHLFKTVDKHEIKGIDNSVAMQISYNGELKIYE
jgi:hypothetical protein